MTFHPTDRDIERMLRERAAHVMPVDIQVSIAAAIEADPRRGARRWPARSRRAILLLAAAVVVGSSIGVGLLAGGVPLPRQPTWPGPVHNAAGMLVQPMAPDAALGDLAWPDGRDAPVNWIDITQVRAQPGAQPDWRMELAAQPPRLDELDPTETVISYGLVFETTGDGRADYVVGINNDAAAGPGPLRVWVTDLATGETEEHLGPAYGYPVEFWYPDEAGPDDDPLDSRTMLFTFLSGSTPPGLTGRSPFYAWSAVNRDGETVAWDYAPDAAWLGTPGPP